MDTDNLLDSNAVAAQIGIDLITLRAWCAARKFPPPVGRRGKRKYLWAAEQVAPFAALFAEKRAIAERQRALMEGHTGAWRAHADT